MFLLKAFFVLPRAFRLAATFLGLGAPIALSGVLLRQAATTQPQLRIPSYIAWTEETIAAASSGSAVRGLVIARRCEHCHGLEGFSSDPFIPNLAGIDRLTIWKQMNDFRVGKRTSRLMQPIAAELSIQDYADLAAYFSMLPTYPDPQDNRSFPQPLPASIHTAEAARLISSGEGQRGIPPCQACHGPIGHKNGAPSLTNQNSTYIQEQLDEFARGVRANDIDMPMRSVASLLTVEERQAVAAYYGAGSATQFMSK